MADGSDWLADNVAGIAVSAIKEMAMRAASLEDVASLTWGLPSFQTPAYIRTAVKDLLDRDPQSGMYSLPDGLPSLCRAVAAGHEAATGIGVNPDRNVVITAGNMQGLNALFHTLLNPGDEIIVTEPGFASHFQQIRLCRGVPVFWPLDAAEGWRLAPEALPGLITPRTKAIVLVSPSNPTGKIFTETELRRVGEIARQHGVKILLDDPYSQFCYENRDRYFNLASVPELADTLIYLFTFSKAYAMTGWRIGYMILPEAMKKEVLKVHDATLICAPRVSQLAAEAALTGEPVHLKTFETILARRRELICARLDRLPHVFAYRKPEGAYYIFPRIVADHGNAHDFCIDVLEKAHVTLTPGAAFGPSGEHHLRMAYCVADEVIDSAFDRLEKLFGV
ncbi:pyridoxal phosphate-dependent aminotransferase [Pelagibius sp. CAU 1746]|uniref:pyridoxal phosphate-dependent aminotransferase n=1 Tax=Pelagibius sp. CAU 1746 TaxID=3140370 RepID=UPI00325C150D